MSAFMLSVSSARAFHDRLFNEGCSLLFITLIQLCMCVSQTAAALSADAADFEAAVRGDCSQNWSETDSKKQLHRLWADEGWGWTCCWFTSVQRSGRCRESRKGSSHHFRVCEGLIPSTLQLSPLPLSHHLAAQSQCSLSKSQVKSKKKNLYPE